MRTTRQTTTGRPTVGSIMAWSLIVAGLVGSGAAAPAQAAGETKRQRAKVIQIIDGDTLKVRLSSGRRRHVRMIGIDAPAVSGVAECGGPEASQNLARLLPRGQRVTLVSDPTQSNMDPNGRLLRYVVKPSGKDVNRAQLGAGWARLHISDVRFRRIDLYRKSRNAARDAKRGLWGLCSVAIPSAESNLRASPDDTGVVSGAGYSLAAVGDRTILGGRFARFDGKPRSNVAAVRSDGSADPNFIADTDGQVGAVATSADGSTVFLGGTFTTVNGVPRANLAAVDATTGAVLTGWSADTSGDYPTVSSLAVHDDRLYVGGRFSGIDGTGRARIAAVAVASGDVITTFNARANGPVLEVVVSPDGGTVYAGGGFSKLSGASRSGNAGAVSASDGAATAFDPYVESGTGVVTVALSPDGSRFFLATQNNFVRAYDPAGSSNPVWSLRMGGNTQAIAASSTEVYLGGHWPGFREFGITRPFLGSVSMSNGVPTTWDTKCSGDKMGVWALLIQGSKLHTAGVFRYFASDPQRGYARFSGTPTP
jgi:endonuclease YncB( thermonuclease family)